MTVSAVADLEKIAMIFEVCGGITDTARVHAITCERGFDVFLGEDAQGSGTDRVVTRLIELQLKGRRREPLAPHL